MNCYTLPYQFAASVPRKQKKKHKKSLLYEVYSFVQ